MSRAPFLLAVAGGTGSGKTTVADRLASVFGGGRIALVPLDAYYRDRSHLPFAERVTINYDHPDAFDWPLLRDQLRDLLDGRAVEVPVYDYVEHTRSSHHTHVDPAPIVCLEGILVLYEAELRQMFDLKVYVDTDPDVRFIRRLQRDIAERGRSMDSVIEQYLETVRPSHEQFIEPTKRYADVIVPHGGRNDAAFDMLVARLRELG